MNDACVSTCPAGMVVSGSLCVCNSSSYFHETLFQCKACNTINAHCTSCQFDATNYEGDCLVCSQGTLSADKRYCVVGGCPNIAQCTTVNSLDCTLCDLCATGYHWNGGTKICDPCSTIDPSCTGCSSAGVCSACSGGKVPQVGGLSCVTAPANCQTLLPTDSSKCQTCNTGYIVNPSTQLCLACNQISSCTSCSYNASSALLISCSACSGGKLVNIGAQSCVTSPSNCQTVNATDLSKCEVCNPNYALHTGTKQCIACSSISSCSDCVYNASSGLSISCSVCSGGLVPQVNG